MITEDYYFFFNFNGSKSQSSEGLHSTQASNGAYFALLRHLQVAKLEARKRETLQKTVE